jgi:hypothetical protein
MTTSSEETQLSPAVRLFVRLWRERWPEPRDWGLAQIRAGTSSLMDWANEIDRCARTDGELTMVTKTLDLFREEAPRLKAFRSAHARTTGRTSAVRSETWQRERCPDCDDTGYVTALVTRPRQGSKWEYVRPGLYYDSDCVVSVVVERCPCKGGPSGGVFQNRRPWWMIETEAHAVRVGMCLNGTAGKYGAPDPTPATPAEITAILADIRGINLSASRP